MTNTAEESRTKTLTTQTASDSTHRPAVCERHPKPIAQARADASLFACRRVGGRRIAARVEKHRGKFQYLWFLSFGVPPFMDIRDLIPAAQSLVERMTREGGAGFVHVVHRDGRPNRISGFILSNRPIGPERRRFAMATGTRPRALHVHCAKVDANISFRLRRQIMPALSTNPAHPPMTIATGNLKDPYDEVATKLAHLAAQSEAASVIDVMPPKKLGQASCANNAMDCQTKNGRKCIQCGKPIGERGNRAMYCKRHGTGTQAARQRLGNRNAQAKSGATSNSSATIPPAEPAGPLHAVDEEAVPNGVCPVARQDSHDTCRRNGTVLPSATV